MKCRVEVERGKGAEEEGKQGVRETGVERGMSMRFKERIDVITNSWIEKIVAI